MVLEDVTLIMVLFRHTSQAKSQHFSCRVSSATKHYILDIMFYVVS